MDDFTINLLAQNDELKERVRQLEEALAPSSVVVPPEFRLTGSEARLFSHLATRDMVTKKSALLVLYSDRNGIDVHEKIVDVFICKLRRKLIPFGLSIRTHWGQGWSLSDRARFKAAMP